MTFSEVARVVCGDLAGSLGARSAALLVYDDAVSGFAVAAAVGGCVSLWGRSLKAQAAESLLNLLEQGMVGRPGADDPSLFAGQEFPLLLPLCHGEPVGVLAVADRDLGRTLPDNLLQRAGDAAGRLLQARPGSVADSDFRDLLELHPGGIALVEGPKHVVVFATGTFRQLVAAADEPFLGRPLHHAAPSAFQPEHGAWFDEVYQTGRPVQHRRLEVEDAYGTRVFELHLVPKLDQSGAVSALMVVLRARTDEVTTRQALETSIARLAESESAFAGLLEATNNGIVFVGDDLTVQYVNRQVKKLFGTTAPDLVGRDVDQLIECLGHHVADPVAFAHRSRYLYRNSEERATDEVEVVRPTHRVLERYSGPVYRADGSFHGRIEAYTDVTAARELQRNKDDFLSLVSHELRTPVTSIKGYAQLLRRRAQKEDLSPATAVAFEVIERQTARMQELIDFLLDVTRLELGRLALQMEAVDLIEVAERVAKLEHLVNDEVQVLVEHADLPLLVKGDERRLEQVLSNLLSNALRYTPPGGTVSIRVESHDQEVRLSVVDSGPGIAAEHLPHVFERFYRVDGSPESSGMGIGLYITKGIVERHGGRILAESQVGSGTVFTVWLPRHETDAVTQ